VFPCIPDHFCIAEEAMSQVLFKFCRHDVAVSAIEYALLGAFIAVVIAAVVGNVGVQLLTLFTNVKDQVVLAMS
jgi:pilus assembly protein Flp/PilA